ncbi:MAG: cupin domain-containing protein [Kouleothrix sp.]|jgi:predicted cupin superfamily sugar epimerase|nr:cupin domain-containing protein [Kouleothrix sp.]
MLTAEQVIALLALEPLPIEGGYFRRSYTSEDLIATAALPARYAGARQLCGAIYYMLHANEFSALHRLATDEIYHFYLGDPLELLLLYPDGSHVVHVLGPDLLAGQLVQLAVPRGVWQGSRLRAGGRFALLGTTMAPAYDQADFELGERAVLLQQYPACSDLINALTRHSR